MKRIAIISFLMMGVLAGGPAAQAQDDNDLASLQDKVGREWQLIKQSSKPEIRSWVKREDGHQIRSFRIEATLNGTLEAFLQTAMDAENYGRWHWQILESRTLKRISPQESIVYLKHKAPYSLPDRDVVVRVQVKSSSPGEAVLSVEALPNYIPATPGVVRMPAENMTVKVSVRPGRQLAVEAEGFFDPGGQAPDWAANFVQRSAPYNILLGLQRVLSLAG
ncbi:MAG TPA: START domain-containing protein [Fluviicoccus sp.]|nr:START domain-containing protein [Fluviicoccus sp.]